MNTLSSLLASLIMISFDDFLSSTSPGRVVRCDSLVEILVFGGFAYMLTDIRTDRRRVPHRWEDASKNGFIRRAKITCDIRTDKRMNRWTDTTSYRDPLSHLYRCTTVIVVHFELSLTRCDYSKRSRVCPSVGPSICRSVCPVLFSNNKTRRTEFGQQMRFGKLPAYLSLNRLLNGILSYS